MLIKTPHGTFWAVDTPSALRRITLRAHPASDAMIAGPEVISIFLAMVWWWIGKFASIGDPATNFILMFAFAFIIWLPQRFIARRARYYQTEHPLFIRIAPKRRHASGDENVRFESPVELLRWAVRGKYKLLIMGRHKKLVDDFILDQNVARLFDLLGDPGLSLTEQEKRDIHVSLEARAKQVADAIFELDQPHRSALRQQRRAARLEVAEKLRLAAIDAERDREVTAWSVERAISE